MKLLLYVFWNSDEKRIRGFFRILIEFIAYVLISAIPLSSIFGGIDDYPEIFDGMTPPWVIIIMAFLRIMQLLTIPLFGRLLDKRPLSKMGINLSREWWRDMMFGLALGAIMMAIIFGVELALGWVTITDTYYLLAPDRSFYLVIAVYFILLVAAGASEELFYRAYILTNICEGLNFNNKPKRAVLLALLLASILFGLTHVFNDGATIVSTLNIILGGILLATAYILTGRLALSIGLHITWNFFQGNVFGFAISGNRFLKDAVSFYSIEQSGPDSWTGGVFGPEGGLLGLIAIVLSIAAIIGYVFYSTGRIKIYTPLAMPPDKK